MRLVDADVLMENIKNRYLDDPVKADEFIRLVTLELDRGIDTTTNSHKQLFLKFENMEVPSNCYECKFAYCRLDALANDDFSRYDFACSLTHKTLTSTKRNKACPIVPYLGE